MSFSVNLINDTPVVEVDHPQETGFVNKLDDVGVPINPQVVFPEGTVKLIDNDDQTIVSLTVKIRNSENGDLLFISQNNPLVVGMDVSEYDSSTGSITLSGSFTLDTYAKEVSKLLYANSRNDAVPGNRIFELTINDGKEGRS